MNAILRVAIAAAGLAAGAAIAAGEPAPCAKDPAMEGMRARMKVLDEQMERIEGSTDRAEQRRLMDLHLKHMHEGMRELRRRDMPAECRLEMMGAMMDSMVRHEQAMHGDSGR